MSNNFRYLPFVAVFGNLGGKIPVVDDVLLSPEQEIYFYDLTWWKLNRIWISKGSELLLWFKTDVLGFGTNLSGVVARKLTIGKKYEKVHKDKGKADEEETAEEKAPVPLITHVNNILPSIFSNVEVYINHQQICNSKGL